MYQSYTNTVGRLMGLITLFILISFQPLLAQSGSVRGTVSDELGNSLPGANVVLEGTTLGASTDDLGQYVILDVPVGEYTARVSYIGYTASSQSTSVVTGVASTADFTLKASQLLASDIIVTAGKRSEKMQDVPISISAQTTEMLEATSSSDVRDYVSSLPGVNLQSISPAENDITIRGVVPMAGWASTVGFYLDETPVSEAGMFPSVTSFDVERVEVLRGPQGTLYGEGSMGGTIRIIPTQPNPNAFQVKLDPQFSSTENGGLNTTVNGMVNIPLIRNKFAIRTTGFYQDNDGWIDNVGLDMKKVNTHKTYGGRLVGQFVATQQLLLTASATVSQTEAGGQYYANEDLQQTTLSRENLSDNYSLYNFKADYATSFADLILSTSYYTRSLEGAFDLAFVLPDVNGLMGMFGLGPYSSLWTDNLQDFQIFSAETRLVSNTDGPLKWTVGAFYKDYDYESGDIGDTDPHVSEEEVQAIAGALVGMGMTFLDGVEGMFLNESKRKIDQIAGFGEVSYDLTSRLNVLGGIRVFQEQREFYSNSNGLFALLQSMLPPSSLTESGDATVVNPKLTLTYKPAANVLVYTNAAKGYRSGGQNTFAYLFSGAPTSYDPESLWNSELGIKTTSLGGHLVANAALYYNSWTDMQVHSRSYASLNVTENVGEAHTAGIDAELSWTPMDGLLLTAGGNFTEAVTDVELLSPAGVDTLGQEVFDTVEKGTKLPFVPESSFNLAAQYTFPLTNSLDLMTRIDYNNTAESTTALLYAEQTPAYANIDLNIRVKSNTWEVYMFAKNLSDERAKYAYWFESPELGTMYNLSTPRTIGCGLRLKL